MSGALELVLVLVQATGYLAIVVGLVLLVLTSPTGDDDERAEP